MLCGGGLIGTSEYKRSSMKTKANKVYLPIQPRGLLARTYSQTPMPSVAISTTIVPGIEFLAEYMA
jgi:hypothetical protein